MGYLAVSSLQKSKLPVLLSSTGTTVFSVGISRGAWGSSLLNASICGNPERASRMRFPSRAIPKTLDTAGTCKRVQIFVLVALILFPQSVREVVQEYRSE